MNGIEAEYGWLEAFETKLSLCETQWMNELEQGDLQCKAIASWCLWKGADGSLGMEWNEMRCAYEITLRTRTAEQATSIRYIDCKSEYLSSTKPLTSARDAKSPLPSSLAPMYSMIPFSYSGFKLTSIFDLPASPATLKSKWDEPPKCALYSACKNGWYVQSRRHRQLEMIQ